MCVDHCMGLMEHIFKLCYILPTVATIAALEVSIRDECECIDVHTDCTTHNIGGNFNVAKDSKQTLTIGDSVKLGCGFISEMCVWGA